MRRVYGRLKKSSKINRQELPEDDSEVVLLATSHRATAPGIMRQALRRQEIRRRSVSQQAAKSSPRTVKIQEPRLELTLEQVTQLAPDENSVASARQLLSLRYWSGLGLSERALWANCQGSATYAVRVDFSNLGLACNCPSRKRPCRHSLGLLMMLVANPDVIPVSEEPPEIQEWLEKRRGRLEKQAAKASAPEKPVDEAARQKRMDRREDRIQDGIERLRLWMCDLLRSGLAGLETRGATGWEDQAKRLVDAQASGLAQRVRRLGEIPGTSPQWPRQLLEGLGRLELLLTAYNRLTDLPPELQFEVRQLIGWNVQQSDLEELGEKVPDDWVVLSQEEEDDDRLRAQRTWLQAVNSGRFALILQFAPGNQPFGENWIVGTLTNATLTFYPGVSQSRARTTQRQAGMTPYRGELSGAGTLEEFLTAVARQLAVQPWQASFPGVLKGVTLARERDRWFVRDTTGQGVPLNYSQPWRLLALSGGHAVDLFGEWNGHSFRPLSLHVDQQIMEL